VSFPAADDPGESHKYNRRRGFAKATRGLSSAAISTLRRATGLQHGCKSRWRMGPT